MHAVGSGRKKREKGGVWWWRVERTAFFLYTKLAEFYFIENDHIAKLTENKLGRVRSVACVRLRQVNLPEFSTK